MFSLRWWCTPRPEAYLFVSHAKSNGILMTASRPLVLKETATSVHGVLVVTNRSLPHREVSHQR
ncbi:hypothetical protein E2C01_088718 [Portunus trituberculatus]|uniref:Uncharacterized protein n=1 Tax=Portunus trituberculatus TaxID=210409 RepID=A0A5B7JMM8_PORTR|nr:hypothetical protein [Portunus trituberculatus]